VLLVIRQRYSSANRPNYTEVSSSVRHKTRDNACSFTCWFHRRSTLDYGCSAGHSTCTHGQTTSSCSPHCPGSYSAGPGTSWCTPSQLLCHCRQTPLSRRIPMSSQELDLYVVPPSRNRRHIPPARSSYPVRSLKYYIYNSNKAVGLVLC